MLILAIFGVISFIFWWLSEKFWDKTFISTLSLVLAGVSVIVAIIGGIFIPTAYHKPKLAEAIKLVTLSDTVSAKGEGGFLYISVSPENNYSYRYEIETDYKDENAGKTKAYKKDIISGDHIIELEEEICPVPKLEIYKVKSKVTLWSFGLAGGYDEYVFHVPTGSISHTIQLD